MFHLHAETFHGSLLNNVCYAKYPNDVNNLLFFLLNPLALQDVWALTVVALQTNWSEQITIGSSLTQITIQATFLCGFGHVTFYHTIQKTTNIQYIYWKHFKKCGHITKTECCKIFFWSYSSCLNCGEKGLKIEKNKLTIGWETIFLFQPSLFLVSIKSILL